MNYIKRTLCGILAALAVMQAAVLPASAMETETTAPTAVTETTVSTEPVAVEETTAPTEVTEPEVAAAPVSEDPEILAAEPEATVETAPAETVPEEVAERTTYDTVPLYFQTDYPDTRYGNGTIETSGCSIVSLAMVATYLTGHEYLPDELARYFGGRAENNIDRLEQACEAMQLPYEKPANWHRTLDALREGKIAIVLMNSRSIFTDSQHFIVLTGLTEDGKILVNDSYAPNYERWDLKNAFQVGFESGDISCGYSGAWVFDPAAIPEEPFIYYEAEAVRGEPRYPEIQLTYEELELLARVVWVEARGECEDGQQAVAEVVLNRLHSDRYPDTLENVIYAEGQFRSVPYLEDAEPTQAQYEAIEKAIYGPYVLPEDVVFFATYRTNNNTWGEIGGHIFCYQE